MLRRQLLSLSYRVSHAGTSARFAIRAIAACNKQNAIAHRHAACDAIAR